MSPDQELRVEWSVSRDLVAEKSLRARLPETQTKTGIERLYLVLDDYDHKRFEPGGRGYDEPSESQRQVDVEFVEQIGGLLKDGTITVEQLTVCLLEHKNEGVRLLRRKNELMSYLPEY